jgi:acetolactate synthase-1/2/3 large subunit
MLELTCHKEKKMKIKAATGIARILKTEGVNWVSTFPICCVNDALGEEGVPLYMMRDERYAVAVADAFSRVTGGKKIGVCTFQGGVNAAALQMAYGAIGQAFEDSSSVLCISEDVPVGHRDRSRYDIDDGFRSVTKWIGHVDQPQRVPEIMRRAFTYLRTGRPGPVLITLSRPMCEEEYDEAEYPYRPVKGWKSAPDPDDVKAAIKVLLSSQRPLIYVGEGVFYADASDELLRFAEIAQMPVLTTLKGKSAFPENHPLSVGVRGELANHFLRKCDLLFAIGTSLARRDFRQQIWHEANKGKTYVQCTLDEFDINNSYPIHYAVVGDAKLTLQALIEELSAQTGGAVKKNQALLDEINASRQEFMAKYRPLMESNEKPINPYRVYGDLMKTIDLNNSFVTADSGNTRDQTSTVYEARIPRGYLGWGNVSSLGFGLAAAIAAKLAYPERQCVNITGEAGVGYMLGNFEALVRLNIGVTTIHINNGGFGGYGPGFWGPGRARYTWEVSDHSVVDMSKAMDAMGYYAEDVTEPSEIIPALKRAFDENARGRPAYLEIICSIYPVSGKWLHQEG